MWNLIRQLITVSTWTIKDSVFFAIKDTMHQREYAFLFPSLFKIADIITTQTNANSVSLGTYQVQILKTVGKTQKLTFVMFRQILNAENASLATS